MIQLLFFLIILQILAITRIKFLLDVYGLHMFYPNFVAMGMLRFHMYSPS